MERANYDLELYAKALEALEFDAMNEKAPPIGADEDPFEYAKNIARGREYWRTRMLTNRAAVAMLRGTPMSLYVTYPNHFPDPRETDEDGNDVSVNWKEKYEEAKAWAMYAVAELANGPKLLKVPPWPIPAGQGPTTYRPIGEANED